MKKTISVLATLLVAGSAWAGGTTLKVNVSPIIDTCMTGNCVWYGDSCATNADCDFGSFSPKSKASLTGAGRLKVQLTGVVNNMDADATGIYYLHLILNGQTNALAVNIEIPVTGGKGKVDVDVSSFLPPAGEVLTPIVQNLFSPASMPANCPTGNDPANIADRLSDGDCTDGRILGYLGITSGS